MLDRRAAQRAVYDSEARFRGAFNNVATGVLLVGAQGRVVEANPALARLPGWTVGELTGRDVFSLVHGSAVLGAGASRVETAARLFAGAALRAAAGAALGFLFWLGWGLIAIVGAPWYATGLLFGSLAWLAVVAPTLGTLALRGPGPLQPLLAHAVEWLFTCAAIGLLCALAWQRYA